MTITTPAANSQFQNEEERFAAALEDALWILWYYEGDRYQSLSQESVVCSMVDNFDYSIVDAHNILDRALPIHDMRMATGFYDD